MMMDDDGPMETSVVEVDWMTLRLFQILNFDFEKLGTIFGIRTINPNPILLYITVQPGE